MTELVTPFVDLPMERRLRAMPVFDRDLRAGDYVLVHEHTASLSRSLVMKRIVEKLGESSGGFNLSNIISVLLADGSEVGWERRIHGIRFIEEVSEVLDRGHGGYTQMAGKNGRVFSTLDHYEIHGEAYPVLPDISASVMLSLIYEALHTPPLGDSFAERFYRALAVCSHMPDGDKIPVGTRLKRGDFMKVIHPIREELVPDYLPELWADDRGDYLTVEEGDQWFSPRLIEAYNSPSNVVFPHDFGSVYRVLDDGSRLDLARKTVGKRALTTAYRAAAVYPTAVVIDTIFFEELDKGFENLIELASRLTDRITAERNTLPVTKDMLHLDF